MAGSSCEREQPTRNAYKKQLQELDCLKDLDLFETTCKILNIPMEVKKVWARRVYSAYHLENGAGAFKRAFVTRRNAVTTAVKRTSSTNEYDGREREEMLEKE